MPRTLIKWQAAAVRCRTAADDRHRLSNQLVDAAAEVPEVDLNIVGDHPTGIRRGSVRLEAILLAGPVERERLDSATDRAQLLHLSRGRRPRLKRHSLGVIGEEGRISRIGFGAAHPGPRVVANGLRVGHHDLHPFCLVQRQRQVGAVAPGRFKGHTSPGLRWERRRCLLCSRVLCSRVRIGEPVEQRSVPGRRVRKATRGRPGP